MIFIIYLIQIILLIYIVGIVIWIIMILNISKTMEEFSLITLDRLFALFVFVTAAVAMWAFLALIDFSTVFFFNMVAINMLILRHIVIVNERRMQVKHFLLHLFNLSFSSFLNQCNLCTQPLICSFLCFRTSLKPKRTWTRPRSRFLPFYIFSCQLIWYIFHIWLFIYCTNCSFLL